MELEPDTDYVTVTLSNGRRFLVPVRTSPDPSKTTIGPLPPEVAEEWEVRIVPTPFLMRKVQ
jgi:hypothetical protein